MADNRLGFILAVLSSLAVIGIVAYYDFADERVFMSGKLSMRHAMLERGCETCHVPWEGVNARKCRHCHQDKKHASLRMPPDAAAVARGESGETLDCLACHKEHRGRHNNLKSVNRFACTRCHRFQEHPERKGEAKKGGWARSLLFSHPSHIRYEAFTADNCVSCHILSKDGNAFITGKFDEACYLCHFRLEHSREAEDKKTCPTCHMDRDFETLKELRPVMTKAGFSHRGHQKFPCAKCHQEVIKKDSGGDMNSHTVARCAGCHKKGMMNTTCVTCHRFHAPSHHQGASNRNEEWSGGGG